LPKLATQKEAALPIQLFITETDREYVLVGIDYLKVGIDEDPRLFKYPMNRDNCAGGVCQPKNVILDPESSISSFDIAKVTVRLPSFLIVICQFSQSPLIRSRFTYGIMDKTAAEARLSLRVRVS
jgi:hypothetical protein